MTPNAAHEPPATKPTEQRDSPSALNDVLERCPFCRKLNWKRVQNRVTLAEWIECRSCGAAGPKCPPGEAIDGWNMRSNAI